jgi:hypothetical protein
MLKNSSISAAALAVLLFTGCSQSTQPSAASGPAASTPAAPPEMVTAKTAFWPMYKSAQAWSSDAVAIKLSPAPVPGFTNDGGKAAEWQATFGSASKGQYRVFSYAIVTALPGVHKGTSADMAMPWGGQTRDAMPIDTTGFNVDSDAAYKTAAAQAAPWLTKNPGKTPTSLDLGSTFAIHDPIWYIAWGDKNNGFVAAVNANTGEAFKAKK